MEFNAEVDGAFGFGFRGGDNVDDAKGNLRLLREAVAHELGAFDDGNDNRYVGLLGDFQNAAVERQQLVRKASLALRVHHNGALVILDQLGRVVDDADGLPGVVLHERHVADAAYDPAEDRKLQILFLRDKCEVVFAHRSCRHDRVEVGTVVTDQQEAPLGDFIITLVLYPYAAAKQRYAHLDVVQGTVEFAVLIVKFVRIHEQSEECRNHNKEKEQDRRDAEYDAERN